VAGWNLLVLLRPQILAFFILGVLARRNDWASTIGRWGWGAAAGPFFVIAPASVALSIWGQPWSNAHAAATASLDLGLRLAAAILFWRIAVALAPRASGRALSALSPLAFLMFCAHMTMIWFGGELLLGPLSARLPTLPCSWFSRSWCWRRPPCCAKP
jgi:hypothetical protein